MNNLISYQWYFFKYFLIKKNSSHNVWFGGTFQTYSSKFQYFFYIFFHHCCATPCDASRKCARLYFLLPTTVFYFFYSITKMWKNVRIRCRRNDWQFSINEVAAKIGFPVSCGRAMYNCEPIWIKTMRIKLLLLFLLFLCFSYIIIIIIIIMMMIMIILIIIIITDDLQRKKCTIVISFFNIFHVSFVYTTFFFLLSQTYISIIRSHCMQHFR